MSEQSPNQSLSPSPSLTGELMAPGQQKSEQREQQSLEPVVDPLNWLDSAERYAFNYFTSKLRSGSSDSYPIAPSVAEQLLELYLQGRTLAEIRKLNRQFSMGQIVHAAVEGCWNLQRDAYAALTVARAKARAVLAAAEGVELAADIMAALKRLHGDNIARYIQTQDPIHLGSATSYATIKQLKEISEVLMKLTGQEQKKTIGGTVEVKHSGSITTIPISPIQVVPQADAAKVLAEWAAVEKRKLAHEEQ